MRPKRRSRKHKLKKEKSSYTPHLYVFLDNDSGAKIADWFDCPEIYRSTEGTEGAEEGEKYFKIPLRWKIPNKLSNYAFKIPSPDPRGCYVGQDSNYKFYLRHILVTDQVLEDNTPNTAFLILLDLILELQPNVKKKIDLAAKQGEIIDFLTAQQPSYNILCPIYQ